MGKEKLGLALGGGGGKGAYQIGVWKYLAEIGLDSYVSVVSGTSVGALNAVLFSDGDIAKAERIWTEQTEDSILSRQREENIMVPDGFSELEDVLLSMVTNGLFARDGLKGIIAREIDLDAIKKNTLRVYATCTRIPDFVGVSFLLNELDKKNIVQALLASSAIPGVFRPEKVLNDFYYDGGIIAQNNVSLVPLNKTECTQALVIPLNDTQEFHTCYNMTVICPSKDLGDLFEGTLNFSKRKASELIRLGYEDASTIYAESLHELLCTMKGKAKMVGVDEVIATFNDESVRQSIVAEADVIPILLKDEKKDVIKLSACLFDRNSNKIRRFIKMWNASTLEKGLADMFADKQMIVLR